MIVLDTTILVYAAGQDHPLVGPCRELVEAIGAGDAVATTTVEVLQEFAHLRSRRRGRRHAADLTRQFATLLGPTLPLQDADVERGLELFTLHDRVGAFDAVLAAAAIRVGGTLASADRAFAEVVGLRHLDPALPDFLADARQ